jgi:hypothetical protein
LTSNAGRIRATTRPTKMTPTTRPVLIIPASMTLLERPERTEHHEAQLRDQSRVRAATDCSTGSTEPRESRLRAALRRCGQRPKEPSSARSRGGLRSTRPGRCGEALGGRECSTRAGASEAARTDVRSYPFDASG